MLEKNEKLELISCLIPDTKVLATFVMVFSGGYYMKHTYETLYSSQTRIIEIIKNPFFLSCFGFAAILSLMIMWENKALIKQIIKRKTD